MKTDFYTCLEPLSQCLLSKNWLLTTAESCTGGWVAQAVTALAGSSNWFDRGFVTYSNAAKQEMLGVAANTIATQGAVSEATVRAMVQGALKHSHAQVAIAISGIAGPGGGSVDKPVGTVWLAWKTPEQELAKCFVFAGDRLAVRHQAVTMALQQLLELLES
ncbi:CinA family protein [Candidatus Venteria ishoeyi]|uniref:Nicotinamide-nucleotide amidohydrolase PncC n=1 Tax=Candidatus Venteria ishoeyi TaxID=1899563 RepID=A0A1H6F9C9_9GAMM|nr:CinA family protein [Candidatus Venteria ishoeyi]MDM8545466.1 CinA family protein [Candidatus Venteria ishoeyi]SEH06730.1 Nicotinamide-nucleotide amidohydrolase PncC [Candidatus Venteria ishoeyi]